MNDIEKIKQKIKLTLMKNSLREQKFIVFEDILTLESLINVPCGKIFKFGTFLDTYEPGDNNIALCAPVSNELVLWAAVRGRFTERADWSIHCSNPWHNGTAYEFITIYDVQRRGDKLRAAKNIMKLVPCTDEVYERYRG